MEKKRYRIRDWNLFIRNHKEIVLRNLYTHIHLYLSFGHHSYLPCSIPNLNEHRRTNGRLSQTVLQSWKKKDEGNFINNMLQGFLQPVDHPLLLCPVSHNDTQINSVTTRRTHILWSFIHSLKLLSDLDTASQASVMKGHRSKTHPLSFQMDYLTSCKKRTCVASTLLAQKGLLSGETWLNI